MPEHVDKEHCHRGFFVHEAESQVAPTNARPPNSSANTNAHQKGAANSASKGIWNERKNTDNKIDVQKNARAIKVVRRQQGTTRRVGVLQFLRECKKKQEKYCETKQQQQHGVQAAQQELQTAACPHTLFTTNCHSGLDSSIVYSY